MVTGSLFWMHGSAVPWEPQEMSGHTVQPFSEVLLCCHQILFMLLHRCQHTQVALYAAVVVVSDIALNHGNEIVPACKSLAIVSFSLEDSPEPLHRAVVNALGHSGHTLLHLCCLQPVIEGSVGVLKTSVTVKQRVCVRVGLNSSIQCVKYKRIIVAVTDNVSNDPAVIQIQNRTQIHLVYNRSFVPLKLCYIGQPLLIGHSCMKLSVQPILCDVLRIGSLSGAAIVLVLNGRLDIQAATNTQHPFLVHIQLMVMGQLVLDPPVALVWILSMDLF